MSTDDGVWTSRWARTRMMKIAPTRRPNRASLLCGAHASVSAPALGVKSDMMGVVYLLSVEPRGCNRRDDRRADRNGNYFVMARMQRC